MEFDSQSVNSEWIQPQAAGHRNLFRNEIKILDWPDMELSASLAPDSRDQAVDWAGLAPHLAHLFIISGLLSADQGRANDPPLPPEPGH